MIPKRYMSRFKLYHFSPTSLEFVEARWCRTRLAALSAILFVSVLGAGFEANRMCGDVFGLGFQRDRALRAENAVLRNKIRTFANRVENVRETIALLGDGANELRLNVDLPKVGADTRKAGIGGTDQRLDLVLAGDLNVMLNDLRTSMTKAEKELQLEQVIYHEAAAQLEKNKSMYPCIPAIRPMDGYYSMSGYGMRFHPVFHQMLLHEGLDIANAEGTPVYSTGDGVVAMAGGTSTGLGTMIVINHGYGYTTVYGHLSKVLVRSGERVRRGAVIGRSGSTGIVTGPHLHYEVRLNGRLQNPVDHFFDGIDSRMIVDRGASSQQLARR
jgi:murein DD-endopeptidase MepM/ murein hydrolase activator NlpD